MTRHPTSFRPHPSARSGFTLLEVMISVAIMLFLLVGINQVFSTTSATIGAGQAASALTRDQKAAATVFYSDWQGAATFDSPCIILRSATQAAFLNKADETSNGTVTDPLTIEQNGTTTTVNPFTYNYRNHRIDTFSFFSRGSFQRQTGDGSGAIVSSLSSNEAWINYGHLLLPNNLTSPPSFYGPGAADNSATDKNDNNLYASQWVLGRVAMLLRYDSTAAPTFSGYYPRTAATPPNLTPLANSSPASPAGWVINQSVYDVAETSIDRFRQDILAQPTGTNWWTPLIYRFQCDPYSILDRSGAVSTLPTSDKFAKTTPYFLSGCTQFIVEYAGDFLSQGSNPSDRTTYGQISKDSSGAVIDASDGQIDFYVDKSADTTPNKTDMTKWVRRVRWYGLPRNVNTSDDAAGAPVIRGTPTTSGDLNTLIDVIPLADVRLAGGLSGVANFEKFLPWSTSAPTADYGAPGTPAGTYTCVFGPSDTKPKMIRITVTLQDPFGRLANGQTYEYVLGTP